MPTPKAPSVPSFDDDVFIRALARQESGTKGHKVKDGDGGRAIGKYQVHRVFVDDVNMLAGTQYTHEDMRNPAKSEAFVRQAVRTYKKMLKSQGVEPTYENVAYIWNGGRQGWKYQDPSYDEGKPQKRQNLSRYWSKFQTFLPAQKQEAEKTPEPSQMTPESIMEYIQSAELSPEDLQRFTKVLFEKTPEVPVEPVGEL